MQDTCRVHFLLHAVKRERNEGKSGNRERHALGTMEKVSMVLEEAGGRAGRDLRRRCCVRDSLSGHGEAVCPAPVQNHNRFRFRTKPIQNQSVPIGTSLSRSPTKPDEAPRASTPSPALPMLWPDARRHTLGNCAMLHVDPRLSPWPPPPTPPPPPPSATAPRQHATSFRMKF